MPRLELWDQLESWYLLISHLCCTRLIYFHCDTLNIVVHYYKGLRKLWTRNLNLQTILNFGNSVDYDSILSAVNMQSLEHRRYYLSLVLLFKCIKGNGPAYISDLFEPRILRHNLTNSDHNLTQPSYNNWYYHNSFTYKASHLWNQLLSYVKRSTELSECRKHLRSFNLTILRASCKCNFCIS